MASEEARRKESNLYPRCPALEEVMKRFRAASLLLLALSIMFVGFEAPSAQAVLCNDGTNQSSCDGHGGPAPTVTAPTAPTPPVGGCGASASWNGSACVANVVTPTPPVGGCGASASWNGSACVANTTTTPTAPSPPPGGCGINTSWNGTYCAPTTTTTTPTSPGTTSQTATVKCSDGSFRVTALECPASAITGGAAGSANCQAPAFYDEGIKGCKTPTQGAGGSQTATIKCADGTFRVTAIECGQGSTNTGTQSGTTTSQYIQCNDGTGQLSCEKNGGPAAAFRTCPDGSILPVSTACATAQTATIKCADGTFRVTSIECGQSNATPSTTTTNKYDCSTAALRNLDVCGGTTKANLPTCSTTQHLEGFNCVSNGVTGGVIATSANIKCSDGTFRNTAIECEQSVGGKSTVAITCPSNQVVAPSGSYCIYPTTTGTAQGTYRSECAVTPLPASCLVGAPTTFEGATQMAQKATFNQVLTTDLKIQGNNAFDADGVKVGELAKASNGQLFQAAAPPPPPPSTAGGKAAPKKTTKTSSAPVIVMNVLGADNKEILGPDGKPLQTAPIVKQGNFVYTDSNGSPIMATPTLNAAGEAVVHNGKVLMTRLMTVGGNEAMLDSSGKPIMMVPLLGDDGKPLLAPNGEVLYAPPLLNASGKTMINASTGQAILARPMADSSGNAALGADKKPFMGQPLVTKDDKLLTVGGQEIYTGAVGMPLTNSKKQQVQTANKQDVQFGFGGTLIDEGGNSVLGPDGKAIVMNANATPLMNNGLPLLDKNGKAVRVSANGQITDSSGRVILGIDGKAIAIGKSESAEVMKVGSVIKSTVKAPDGSIAVMALNAQIFDKSGNPIVTAAGQPIFFDSKTKKLIDPKGNAVKVEAGGKIVGKIASLAFQTVNFAA